MPVASSWIPWAVAAFRQPSCSLPSPPAPTKPSSCSLLGHSTSHPFPFMPLKLEASLDFHAWAQISCQNLERLHKLTSSQPSVLENSGPPGVREVETGREKPAEDGFLGDENTNVLQRCANNLEVGHSQALSLVSPLILPIYHWPSYLPSHQSFTPFSVYDTRTHLL